jgi:hypothetical protein
MINKAQQLGASNHILEPFIQRMTYTSKQQKKGMNPENLAQYGERFVCTTNDSTQPGALALI